MQESGEALTTAPQTIGLTTGIRTALPGLPGGAALPAGDTLGQRAYRRRAFLGATALAAMGTVGAPRFLVAAAAPPSASTASFPLQPLALDGAAAPAENGGPAAIEHAAADTSPAPALTHDAFRAE